MPIVGALPGPQSSALASACFDLANVLADGNAHYSVDICLISQPQVARQTR